MAQADSQGPALQGLHECSWTGCGGIASSCPSQDLPIHPGGSGTFWSFPEALPRECAEEAGAATFVVGGGDAGRLWPSYPIL